MRKSLIGAFIVWGVLTACSTQKVYLQNEVFSANHCGFLLKDPSNGKILVDVNSSKYFTPASNTKIFTLYAGLVTFEDSLPSFRYRTNEDSLIIWGIGNPVFLNSAFEQNNTFDFLKTTEKNLYLSVENFQEKAFGPGWAWDDYNYAYSLERSPFPVYGNKYEIHKGPDTTDLKITPDYFRKFLYTEPRPAPITQNYLQREISSNLITYYKQDDSTSFTRNIPITWDTDFLTGVLEDTLKKEIEIINTHPSESDQYFYGSNTDSVFQTMMHESDNFLAEQILLMVSEKISDTLRTGIAIDYVKTNYLADLPDEPLWFDGSGLSRYNLFTPRSIVALLEKIYNKVERERIFSLFAGGGENGTIKDWYAGDPTYVYAKTGTLRNNHCLSGYILTKKGKTLVFSFMNNSYNDVSSTYKVEMQKMLEYIHNKY